jgi:ethanolamine utilization protein EutA (predicted chaperonin)
MDVLTKIKASSILENLVASIIVLVVFSIAGASLNQIFESNVNQRELKFDNRVKELEYLSLNNGLALPHEYEENGKMATFSKDGYLLKVSISKKGRTIQKTTCCLN